MRLLVALYPGLVSPAKLVDIATVMSRATRETDRLYRYGGDEFAALLPGADRVVAHEVADRIRRAVAERTGVGSRRHGPAVSISVGVACYPSDGRTKAELVAIADRALYLVKPDRGAHESGVADPYLRALDDTALALLDRTDQDGLLATLLSRAAALLGAPHAWIDLLDTDGKHFVLRVGTGAFADLHGTDMSASEGMAGLRNLAVVGLPLVAMCDSRDLGGVVDSKNLGRTTMILYDRYPGGLGYSQRGFERIDQLPDTPTLKESGIDVEVTNWRGVVAPPGISDDRRQGLQDIVEQMTETDSWQETLEREGWTPVVKLGEEYDEVDITTSPELMSRYGEEIPVTFVDGTQHDYWRVDPARLRSALRAV